MKDLVTLIRVIVGIIGFILMANEQECIKDQNWTINFIGMCLVILAVIDFKFYKKIK